VSTAATAAASPAVVPARRSRLAGAFRHKSLAVGVVLSAFVLALVVIGPFLTSHNPDTVNPLAAFDPPSAAHPFGTDSFGRDMLSRVLYGGRYTIAAAIAIVLLGGAVGSILGIIAGYFRGAVGFVIMRIIDVLLAFPGILLALVAAAILGPGLVNGILALSLIAVPAYARVAEGATIEVRQLPFIDAAISAGVNPFRIITRHILPNVRADLLVLSSSWLGISALWIAALGFIGLGVQPPTPEWGTLLSAGQDYISVAWWITVFPGIFLALFVIGTNLIGDGLRDHFDKTL
jgi:ABC-type dipeptide/oligopeptide/nickel transport system permease subunit